MSEDKAKKYSNLKVKLSLFHFVYTAVILFALIQFGWSSTWRDFSVGFSSNPFILIAVYFVVFSGVFYFFDFPLKFYSSYILEHRYNLSNQNLGDWFFEEGGV